MAIIRFSNGASVNFSGNPTQADIEEVARGFQTQQPEQAQANPYSAVFRATGDEGGVKSGLKALGNVPTSAFTFGKNIVNAVTNPIQTAKGVGNLIADAGAAVTNKLTDITGLGQRREQETAKALGSAYFGDEGRYGSMANAQKTAIEDPFGVGSDLLAVLQGGAGVAGKTAQLNKALSTTAKVATAPIRVPVKAVAKATGSATKFGASQATGLTPDTIGTIIDDPKAFGVAQAQGTTRVDLADDIFGAINKVSDDLSDLGTGYDSVRKSGQIVSLSDDWLTKSLDEFGLKTKYDNAPALVNGVPDLTQVPKATIIADRTSKTRNATDINKIQSFVDNWGDSKRFTAEEYLNMRHDLAELARYDMAGSTVARDFGTSVREGVLNSDKVRNQIPGLKSLDAKYSDDVKFFKQMKKEFLNSEGKLKDGAASKVVNAVNASNPERLARLEKLYPGFTKQAKVIKAVEDVENAMGLKVGTYARAGIGIAGIATGNLPMILGAILATPEVIVPLLKGLGYTNKTIGPVLAAIRDFAGDINNFRVPGAIEEYMKNKYPDGVPVGMSIKDVSKDTLDPKNFKTAEEYVKAQPKIYHGTPETFDVFDTNVTGDGAIWFTENVKDIRANKTGGVSKAGQKLNEMERVIKPNTKLATPAIEEAANGSDDLIAKGYRGVVYPAGEFGDYTHTKLWFPNEDTVTRPQLIDEWKKANTTNLLEEAKGKTLDEFLKVQGTPVYHGTRANFTDFKQSKSGEIGKGVYFYDDSKKALDHVGDEGRVVEAYFDGKLATMDDFRKTRDRLKDNSWTNSATIDDLEKQGFVGIKRPEGNSTVYNIFDPKNIKTKESLEEIWKQANRTASADGK